MTREMQRKSKFLESFHRAKADTTVKRCCKREYGHPVPTANYLCQWRGEFQEYSMVAHKPRAGRPRIGDADVAWIEHAFWKRFATSLRAASAQLGTALSTIRKVLHKKWERFGTRCILSNNYSLNNVLAALLMHSIFVVNCNIPPNTRMEYPSLMYSFFTPMEFSTCIMQEYGPRETSYCRGSTACHSRVGSMLRYAQN